MKLIPSEFSVEVSDNVLIILMQEFSLLLNN